VDNAIKFTQEGEVRFEVSEEAKSDDVVSLHFRIIDTGIGVSEEMAEKIFEPFSQADESNSRRYGGSGLGLSIATELVSLMDGRLWLEGRSAEEGGGTVFHFTAVFPIAHEDEDTAGGRKEGGRRAHGPSARHLSVLVVDDEAVNRIMVTELLGQEGITAVAADSGEKALELLDDVDFDLVLMDVEMPGMDGFEVTRRIREQEKESGRRVRIVAMTAHAVEGYHERCIKAGMDGYVSKPFGPADLLRLVRRGE